MAESLKTFFSKNLVKRLAADLARVAPQFEEQAFVKDASWGLDKLELLARGKHIAGALADHLPEDYTEAIDTLLRSLGPEHATDELIGLGMAPFFYLPHVLYVAEKGLEHFDLSMHAQYELTKRFSAEGSIRPYIAKYPDRTFAILRKWTSDSNAHVRRLVSEGTRLRLPWAMRVQWLDRHPEKVLELLELLKNDPTTLVRRSVANNLNDLGKVHPTLLIQTCQTWMKGANKERRALIEHALRSAIKRGHPDALKILGFGTKPTVRLQNARMTPAKVRIGESVLVSFELKSRSKQRQQLLVDMAVHFVKKSGRGAPKVFKLKRVALAPGATVALQTKISLALHTTRKPQPGLHHVDVLVNGVAKRAGSFTVV